MLVVNGRRLWMQNCRKATFLITSGIFNQFNIAFPFLRCELILEELLAELFLKKADTLHSCNLVLMLSTAAGMNDMVMSSGRTKICPDAPKKSRTGVFIVFVKS